MTVGFLHVPKTAGTSYGSMLARELPGEHLIPELNSPDDVVEFQRTDPAVLRKYSLVAGHFDWDLCRRAPFLRPVTVLRHPIDRLVSTYYYNLRGDRPVTAPWREFFLQRGVGLIEFLSDQRLLAVHFLSQVEQLAGCLWSGDPRPGGDDELLLAATENLSSCVHLGIVERMEDSTRLLSAELGLRDGLCVPHLNSSQHPRASLPAKLREALEARYATEIEFYDWAVEHFERRLMEQGIEPVPDAQPDPPDSMEAVRPQVQAASTRLGRIGDRISLGWEPPVGTVLGARSDAEPSVAVLPIDRVVHQVGNTFQPEPHEEVDTGVNWIRVPRGRYQMDAQVLCEPDGWGPSTEWVVGLILFWCAHPRFPSDRGAPGVPAAPDVTLGRRRAIRRDRERAPGGVRISASGQLALPLDDGHLCLVMGSSLTARAPLGATVSLELIRVG